MLVVAYLLLSREKLCDEKNMRLLIFPVLLASVMSVSSPALAATPTEEFSVCLVDSLNGKERKMFARLVFFSMAAHPEIEKYSKVKKSDLKKTSKSLGEIFTRLLTVDCPNELRAANADDPLALQKAFELVGQVAMQELMTNGAVSESMAGFSKYADMQAIQEVISP